MSSPEPAVRFLVGPVLVARVAAQRACRVPGVAGLRPDLAQALLGFAGSVLGQDRDRLPSGGVAATVDGGRAQVALTIVTWLGHNCRDLAQAVQREVGEAVTDYTGLEVQVQVTIADVLLGDRDPQERDRMQSAQSPPPGVR